MINHFQMDTLILRAYEEDIPTYDVTTDLLFDGSYKTEAYMVAKSSGVICGLLVAKRCFMLLDQDLEVALGVEEGAFVCSGTKLMVIKGSAASILKAERTALNFIQRLSGIATLTYAFVKAIEGSKARIVDTRKTTPGMRLFEKYAVRTGGGYNHRYNLSESVMLKDNHIDAYGSIEEAVTKVREKLSHPMKIEVEVRDLNELKLALAQGVEVIMLDNMSLEEMKKAVEITAGKALLEASGNITLSTVASVAGTGVDIISSGALTHSYQSMDISLKIGKIESEKKG